MRGVECVQTGLLGVAGCVRWAVFACLFVMLTVVVDARLAPLSGAVPCGVSICLRGFCIGE
jgi:hypothetical protein